jgi:hypothetical protein
MTSAGTFKSGIMELPSVTSLHYRAVAEGNATVFGEDMFVTVPGMPLSLPEVTTLEADIAGRGSSVSLHGFLDRLGDTSGPVSVCFEGWEEAVKHQ